MRTLIEGEPGASRWLVFESRAARDAAAAYFHRRGWYTLTFHDVAGPALHAARVWYAASPCATNARGMPTHPNDAACLAHRRIGV